MSAPFITAVVAAERRVHIEESVMGQVILHHVLGLVAQDRSSPNSGQDEFTLAAIAQNLRRLAKLTTALA